MKLHPDLYIGWCRPQHSGVRVVCFVDVKVLVLVIQQMCPQRRCQQGHPVIHQTFVLGIAQKGPKDARIGVVQYLIQIVGVELKCRGELHAQLVHALDPLVKDRRSLLVAVLWVSMADSFVKFVTKTQPFFFDEKGKAFERAVVRIQQ